MIANGLDMETLARRAYDAYAMKTGGRSFEGRAMASWPDLPERVREAWAEAAAAACEALLDSVGEALAR